MTPIFASPCPLCGTVQRRQRRSGRPLLSGLDVRIAHLIDVDGLTTRDALAELRRREKVPEYWTSTAATHAASRGRRKHYEATCPYCVAAEQSSGENGIFSAR